MDNVIIVCWKHSISKSDSSSFYFIIRQETATVWAAATFRMTAWTWGGRGRSAQLGSSGRMGQPWARNKRTSQNHPNLPEKDWGLNQSTHLSFLSGPHEAVEAAGPEPEAHVWCFPLKAGKHNWLNSMTLALSLECSHMGISHLLQTLEWWFELLFYILLKTSFFPHRTSCYKTPSLHPTSRVHGRLDDSVAPWLKPVGVSESTGEITAWLLKVWPRREE